VTPSIPFTIEDYRQVYDGVALPVLIVDHASWCILAVNDAALVQYGYEPAEFVGLPVLEVRPPEGREEARRVMSEAPHGFWKASGVQHCRKDGSVFMADVWSRDTTVDGRSVRIATVHEVTERVQVQRELQQAQKMEVVGRLAAGVAHDFNNALTAIIGGSDLLMEQLREDPDAAAELEAIQRAAHRAARLTRHLLAFSRQQVMRDEICSFPEVVRRSVGLLERVLEGHIELRTQIDPGGWPVQVDAVQLEQVIMNLAVNAQDAMSEGGTLFISTENVSVSTEDAQANPIVPPGNYAQLIVRDTGIGMDEVTRARVFEPFFTTKPAPAGTGLGLSMAYGIVRQSGGFITVDSAPGAGTTFRILLPRASPLPADAKLQQADAALNQADATRRQEATPIRQGQMPGGHTVLVVDGEDDVRRSTGRALGGLGYNVVSVGSAEEALARLEALESTPDLLVTALNLPGMGGRELAERLQTSDPGLGVLFLSGFATEEDDTVRDFDGHRGLLQKPFSLESLREAVRRALAVGPGRAW
jgi:two-component system, cell cycle sensor histidine kinase and response regulator CckA